MSKCLNCGTEFEGNTCPVCGAVLSVPPEPVQNQINQPANQPYVNQQTPTQPVFQGSPYQSNNQYQNAQPLYGENQFSPPVQQPASYSPNFGQTFAEQPKSSIIEDYKKFWKNYVNFNGRARRSEFWHVFLINFTIAIVLSILTAILGKITGTTSYELGASSVSATATGIAAIPSIISSIYSLATLIPGLALTVRRLHDVGKSGAYIFITLIPIVGFILLLVAELKDSDMGVNMYGPSPKYNAPGVQQPVERSYGQPVQPPVQQPVQQPMQNQGPYGFQ